MTAADTLQLGHLTLRNRLAGTAHASGLVRDGLALPGDDEYWARVAHGGVGIAIVGGTCVAPESGYRGGNVLEAFRTEAVPGLRARAEAIKGGGAVAVQQLVHLGRETLGAPIWYAPVGPSAVRSSREPTAPRALTASEVEDVVAAFVRSAANVSDAGYDGVEIHAAHGYLLAQFLSAETNLRDDAWGGDLAGRMRILDYTIAGIRALGSRLLVGVRLSIEPGIDMPALAEIAQALGTRVDWINVTVGPRGEYVRDMATESPPLLGTFAALRAATPVRLLVSQAFRTREQIDRAIDEGADLVGMARPLIADPAFPTKVLGGHDEAVRPCVSCNEDCRLFDPVLLCTVNPELAMPGERLRRAAPHVVQDGPGGGDVAVVGGGVAGLECALALARARRAVTLFEQAEELGGDVALASLGPHRAGWRRLLDFYGAGVEAGGVDVRLGTSPDDLHGFGDIVLAVGAEEVPSLEGALRSSDVIARGIGSAESVVVVDDGFGWWPCVSAVEVALEGGAEVHVLLPSGAFAAGIPADGRTQLQPRLNGRRLHAHAFLTAVEIDDDVLVARNRYSGEVERFTADLVVTVGERRPRSPQLDLPQPARVQAIGDMVVPRRVAHAVAEGRAAAEAILGSGDQLELKDVSRRGSVPS